MNIYDSCLHALVIFYTITSASDIKILSIRLMDAVYDGVDRDNNNKKNTQQKID